jgi:hypothetical protein
LQQNQTLSNAAAALLRVVAAANRRPISFGQKKASSSSEAINMKPVCDQTKHQEFFCCLPPANQHDAPSDQTKHQEMLPTAGQ